VVAFLGGIAASAFTASNTVPKANVGQGAGSISGYTLSGSVYTLDPNDPRIISTVTFTLDAPQPAEVRNVKAKVTNGSYQTCSTTGGTSTTSNWSCTLNTAVTAAGTTTSVAGAQ
jgi:hypothetical protein